MTQIQVAVTKEQAPRLNAFVLVGVLLTFASTVHADTPSAVDERKLDMTQSEEKCGVPPPSKWTEQQQKKWGWTQAPKWTEPEEWAWTQICGRQGADFNERYEEKLDLRNPSHDCKCLDNRKLSSRFLETILLREPFRSAIPYRGVRIVGAYFPHCINLRGVVLERQLMLYGSYFDSKVDMTFLKTSTFLALTGSKFDDELVMNTISIESSLYMESAEFEKTVHLGGAKVDRRISMNGAKFKDRLSMHSTSVGLNLAMLRGAEFYELVDLSFLRVGSEIEMKGAKFKGKLLMRSASVDLDLDMLDAEFGEPADLSFLRVGANLDARGATLRGLDLTGTRIEGELQIGSPGKEVNWKGCEDDSDHCQAPRLILRNTGVGALQDTKDTWSSHLKPEFEGFTYDRLGGFGASAHDGPYERKNSWFIEWLAQDESYSPQPYRHLASVLRTAGYEDKANAVLVASRDRELEETDWWPPKWLWLWMLKLFIGYGYGLRYFYALIWIAVLALLGTFILYRVKEEDKDGIKLGFWYSLDMLLPIIHLRDQHYTDVDLKTWAKYYFYFHKIMGYVLISFVLAGLSGLVE